METKLQVADDHAETPPTSVNRLHEVRKSQRKTLRECAEAVGVTYQAIHKAERRSDAMALSKWIKLAEYLGTPLHEIVCQ